MRALSCISCAKRARRLKIVLRSGNICTNVIAGSGRSVALRRCHTGNAPRSSSVNQLLLPGRLASRRRKVSSLNDTSPGLTLCNTRRKLRGGGPAPYRSPRARRVEAGPSPPPPAWPAHNLLFGTQRRRREKMRLSDAFVKRVFQEQAHLCAALLAVQ